MSPPSVSLSSLMATLISSCGIFCITTTTCESLPTSRLGFEAKVGAGTRFRAVQMFPDASACPRLLLRTISRSATSCLYPLESSANERCPRAECTSSSSLAAPSMFQGFDPALKAVTLLAQVCQIVEHLGDPCCTHPGLQFPALTSSFPLLPTELCTQIAGVAAPRLVSGSVHFLISPVCGHRRDTFRAKVRLFRPMGTACRRKRQTGVLA